MDGLPERLLIERDGPASRLQPGAMLVARVVRIEKGLGLAFLEGDPGEAMVCARAGRAVLAAKLIRDGLIFATDQVDRDRLNALLSTVIAPPNPGAK